MRYPVPGNRRNCEEVERDVPCFWKMKSMGPEGTGISIRLASSIQIDSQGIFLRNNVHSARIEMKSIYLSIYRSYSLLLDLGLCQFLNPIQPVGLLGRGISSSQGRYLHIEHKQRINAYRHLALSRTRAHDPSVRVSDDSSCLWRRGHCDRPEMKWWASLKYKYFPNALFSFSNLIAAHFMFIVAKVTASQISRVIHAVCHVAYKNVVRWTSLQKTSIRAL
jgi:hypothetical protein